MIVHMVCTLNVWESWLYIWFQIAMANRCCRLDSVCVFVLSVSMHAVTAGADCEVKVSARSSQLKAVSRSWFGRKVFAV